MSDRVSISQTRLDRSPAVLKAHGLGSCVAIAIYDPTTKLGGLGHMLLPNSPTQGAIGSESKYVDAGVELMVDSLVEAGADRSAMIAKIAGGANMFESLYQTLINSIGARNARSARETLTNLGIPIAGEEIGGNRGRTVEFDLASGELMVYCAREDVQTVL